MAKQFLRTLMRAENVQTSLQLNTHQAISWCHGFHHSDLLCIIFLGLKCVIAHTGGIIALAATCWCIINNSHPGTFGDTATGNRFFGAHFPFLLRTMRIGFQLKASHPHNDEYMVTACRTQRRQCVRRDEHT